jgi:hypothetical protein
VHKNQQISIEEDEEYKDLNILLDKIEGGKCKLNAGAN